MNFNNFMDLDVNMKDFTDIYNNYTNNKKNFGGGKMKIRDLINTYLNNNNKIKKGGGNEDNLFYSMRYDTSDSDILTMNDYKYNSMLFPSNLTVNRS